MIMEELITIAGSTSNIKALPNIRLAAESETWDNKTEWRDYYTGARLDNFTKPWKPHHETGNKDFLLLDTNRPLESSWDQGWDMFQDMGCLCESDVKYEYNWDHPPLLTLWGVETCSALRTKDYWN